MKTLISRLALTLVFMLSSVVVSTTPAAAYGRDAVWQIGFSFNCNDPVACAVGPDNPFGPGGFWGWIELDSTTHPGTAGDADIVVTGCDHFRTTIPHGGVDHFNLDGTWFSSGGLLFVSAAEFGGTFFVIPAAAGHYSLHPAPAIAMELQLALIPNR